MNKSADVLHFIELIEKRSDLMKNWSRCDPKVLNKILEEYHKIFKKLINQDRLVELQPFLNHPNKSVRGVIAAYYLVQDEKTAVKILEELSKEDGLIGMGSRSNLEEWRKGNLHFDY